MYFSKYFTGLIQKTLSLIEITWNDAKSIHVD